MHRRCQAHTSWRCAGIKQPGIVCQSLVKPLQRSQQRQARPQHTAYSSCSTSRQLVRGSVSISRRDSVRVLGAAMVEAEAEAPACTAEAKLVSFENGTYTVEGSLETPLPVPKVWRVLTDYEGLANVFSNIKSSSIASREPDFVLHQDCEWKFLVFSGTFGAELRVNEDRVRNEITFNLVKSSFMNAFVGQWLITPIASGGSLIEHRLTVQPQVSPPAFMAGYTQKIFVRQVTNIMGDLEQELSKHS